MPGLFFYVPKKRGKGCDIGNLQCNPENIDSQLTAALLGSFRKGLSLASFQGHTLQSRKRKMILHLRKQNSPKMNQIEKGSSLYSLQIFFTLMFGGNP